MDASAITNIVKKHKPFTPTVKIVLGYLLLICLGTILLLMPFASNDGGTVGFVTALFTSTSATCVTGLVVVDTLSAYNFFGQLVIFVLFEMGGLGFMTIAALLIAALGKKLSLKDRISIAESFNTGDYSQAASITKIIAATMLIVELLGAVGCFPVFLSMDRGNVGLAIWRSIFHAGAAFCNAGFDLMGGSLALPLPSGELGMAPFVSNPLFNIVTMAIMFCGGIGAGVITNVWGKMRGREKITFNTKVIVISHVAFWILGAAYIYAAEYFNPLTMGPLSTGDKIMASMFHSLTTRSAGLNTIDPWNMTAAGTIATIFLMLVGAAPASTGGGLKLSTVIVVIASLKAAVQGNDYYGIAKHGISRKTFNKAVSIVILFALAFVVAILTLCLSDGGTFTLTQLAFEAVSALTNCGLLTGVSAGLSVLGKLVIISLMYAGRVGFLCIVYSFIGAGKPNVRYADSKIIIG